MTKREFFKRITEMENLDADLLAMAKKELEKYKPTQTQLENIVIKRDMMKYFAENSSEEVDEEGKITEIKFCTCASEVAEHLDISIQKASALLRSLTEQNFLTSEDVKVKGSGHKIFYTLNKFDEISLIN